MRHSQPEERLRLVYISGAPIHVQACIAGGSRYNTIPGQAHAMEHMLVAGTKSFTSKRKLALHLEQSGGYFSAITDPDFTRFTVSVPEIKYLNDAFLVLGEILSMPLFDRDTFETEKRIIAEEYATKLNNPEYRLQREILQSMYEHYALRINNLGTPESLAKLAIADIKAHWNTYVTKERTNFIVTGDVTHSDVAPFINAIELRSHPTRNEDMPSLGKVNTDSRVFHVAGTRDVANVMLAYRCDTESLDDYATLQLTKHILTGRSNPLMQKLRYERGLVYSGSTTLTEFKGSCVLLIRTMCHPRNTQEVISILTDTIHSITSHSVDDVFLTSLKTRIKGNFKFALQTSKDWLDAETAALKHGAVGTNASEILRTIDNLHVDTFNKNIQKYFASSNEYCAYELDTQ